MTVRSLFAALAAGYFLIVALAFLAPDAFVEEMMSEGGAIAWELAGEPESVAVTVGIRAVAGGLVLVSLALVEWGPLVARFKGSEQATGEESPAADQG